MKIENKINILYLGAFPPDFLIRRTGGKIDSLYRDDQAIIRGLRAQDNVNLSVITSPDISSWPYGPLFVCRETNKEEGVTMVSSLNVSIIKQFWTIISLTIEAVNYIRKSSETVVAIIPYVVFRHVFSLRLLKLIFGKKIMQAVVVPDIFFPSNWFLKRVNLITEKMASKFDAFVLYTEKMAEHLHVQSGHYEVIEGFREISDRKPVPDDIFKIVYAGSLNINYGIGRLLEAMSMIDDSQIHLHLYGSGTAEKLIREVCRKDERIVFHGKVSNKEAGDAIYSASVLINPRNANDGDYTEYSFPSKDIEYMATGVPTLLCKLPGMPKEYYGHFIDIEDGTPEQIAKAIIKMKTMSSEDRNAIGQDARGFIVERMDCKKQGKRIVRLFNRLLLCRI